MAAGRLWVIATPIGNLDDLSPRASAILRDVEVVAAEDTRHSAPLLARVGSKARMLALHEHNEREQATRIVEVILGGRDVALIADAGTPLISDPGFRLVRAVREAGASVSPIPGPCAAIAALSVAGLPSDRFVFEGFLPAKSAARRERMTALATESRTLIFYESSHRIVESVDDAVAVFGATRQAVLARELTKLYETVIAAPLLEIAERIAADANQQRGEFVLLVAGAVDADADTQLAEGRRVFALLREELAPAKAAKLAAAITGAPRKALYHAE
ncbi:MAG TPA: 16S rRNA (cytidine(1402)-2'-O)-methyltransferase [Rhodanobacteraceae bacterium]|nr:16S rRNA (cytidine(1402)-2'-O)-methyltransferase [Rhodanobacteraceae bacterium]